MRFGVRKPSLRGRISARTSWKRYARHSMGFKAPRGAGFLTNPKKALYNRVYNRTTVSADDLLKPSRSGGYDTGSSFRLPESVSIALISAALVLCLTYWLDFSVKWMLIWAGAVLVFGIVGEEGFKALLFIGFIAWVFFLRS